MTDTLIPDALVDEVDRIVDELVTAADPFYGRLLAATYDEQAFEGSLAADDLMAAEYLRRYARKHGGDGVAKEKLATIVRVMNAALTANGWSREKHRLWLDNLA